jgi:hypothetical protein
MKTKQYKVTLTGETPLLMHHDNLAWADTMKQWGSDPSNKKKSIAGDDRSPAWRWIGALYVGGGRIVIPSDCLMTVLREGAKRCPTGKGQTTFKAQSQSGLIVDQSDWPLLIDGKEIPYDPIKALIENEEDFSKHLETAVKLGFELFVKRAVVGQSKHIRVRPRFNRWSCSGTVTVLDEQITETILDAILKLAGNYAGLGDWRPSSPKSPGPFGKFTPSMSLV